MSYLSSGVMFGSRIRTSATILGPKKDVYILTLNTMNSRTWHYTGKYSEINTQIFPSGTITQLAVFL